MWSLYLRKSTHDYEFIFQLINSVVEFSPEKIMVDFELALQHALSLHFSSAKIFGCKFHFIQANSRWLKNHGVKGDDKRIILEKLATLAELDKEPSSQIKGLNFFISVYFLLNPNH